MTQLALFEEAPVVERVWTFAEQWPDVPEDMVCVSCGMQSGAPYAFQINHTASAVRECITRTLRRNHVASACRQFVAGVWTIEQVREYVDRALEVRIGMDEINDILARHGIEAMVA